MTHNIELKAAVLEFSMGVAILLEGNSLLKNLNDVASLVVKYQVLMERQDLGDYYPVVVFWGVQLHDLLDETRKRAEQLAAVLPSAIEIAQ
jgi:hypothetical protein